jgi:hypothetical protein
MIGSLMHYEYSCRSSPKNYLDCPYSLPKFGMMKLTIVTLLRIYIPLEQCYTIHLSGSALLRHAPKALTGNRDNSGFPKLKSDILSPVS